MAEHLQKLALRERAMRFEIDRCLREIAEAEIAILSGNLDVIGLCMAVADWSAESRLLQTGTLQVDTPQR
jgi:hypothetical protein